MMDEDEKRLIQETHDSVLKLTITLLGTPDTEDTGLMGEVKSMQEAHNCLTKKHNKLSQRLWILIAFLAGSGVLGAGIWGLLNGG